LRRLIHVDAYEFARSAPERVRQRLSVRDRLVKPRRSHMKPMSLPVLKQVPKVPVPKAHRNHRSDELGKLRHVDIPPPSFVRNFPESGWCRLNLTPCFDRVDCYFGLLATYRRNSFTFESLIHGISTRPDDPPCVTSFPSFAPVETRTSAPAGSFVSQEITQRCPRKSRFGFAFIFPVISPVGSILFTAGDQR
jgi:hypothetical protein